MEAIGLVLAIVQTIDICINHGHAVAEMCRALRDADVELQERSAIVESSVFRTTSQLKIIKEIHEDLDAEFIASQTRLYDIFTLKMKSVHNQLNGLLERKTDEHGEPFLVAKKGRYLFVKRSLDAAIEELERWQTRFDPTWKLIMLRSTNTAVNGLLAQPDATATKRASATSMLKTTGTLRRIVKDGQRSGNSTYLRADEISGMAEETISFSPAVSYRQRGSGRTYIVDTVEFGSKIVSLSMKRALQNNVRDLAEKLQFIDSAKGGILQCKGFFKKDEESYGIVFRQPQHRDASHPTRSLRTMLLSPAEHSLTVRVDFAKQLARAVSYIHSLGFVHKNIRPETVVGFWIDTQGQTVETVFMVGFGQFRAEYGATSLLGDSDWEKNLYRHPDRQGVHPEEEYMMQHDIYSLGVCLLEIGLWKSLVSYDGHQKAVRAADLISPVPHESPQTSWDTKATLVALARSRIAPSMGDRYRDIVVNCLTCLDDDNVDFADKMRFQDETGIQVGAKYIEKIMLGLEDIEV